MKLVSMIFVLSSIGFTTLFSWGFYDLWDVPFAPSVAMGVLLGQLAGSFFGDAVVRLIRTRSSSTKKKGY